MVWGTLKGDRLVGWAFAVAMTRLPVVILRGLSVCVDGIGDGTGMGSVGAIATSSRSWQFFLAL